MPDTVYDCITPPEHNAGKYDELWIACPVYPVNIRIDPVTYPVIPEDVLDVIPEIILPILESCHDLDLFTVFATFSQQKLADYGKPKFYGRK